MTALPPKAELDGSSSGHNQGVFKTAIGALRDFMAGLLGTDGTQASAIAALKVLDPQAIYNLKPVFTVGSNALTCTIKDRAGNDLSSTNPGFIGQRSATASDGGFNLRTMTANVALTISSGSTLGHTSGVAEKLYWYLLDNAGVQVLAVSGSFQGFSGIYSTTAEGGAGAADSGSIMYAVASHSDLPGRLIAVSTDTQTTAGTWTSNVSNVQISPFPKNLFLDGDISIPGDITPSQITANQNDYNPTGLSTASVLRLSSDASRNVTGLQGGSDGRIVSFLNVGSFPLVFATEDAASTAANRFAFEHSITLMPKQGFTIIYDSIQSRWVVMTQPWKRQGITSGAKNLRVILASAASITITADEIQLNDSNGNSIVLSSVSVTPSLAASGANGLDTGAEASNTWYYGWVIAKPDGTVSGLLSTSSTGSGLTMPSGYTFRALVGAYRNDGSSNFINFNQFGNNFYYLARQAALSAGTATAETSVSVSSLVPPIAATILLENFMYQTADGGGNLSAVLYFGYVSGSDYVARSGVMKGHSGGAGGMIPVVTDITEIPNNNQQFYYRCFLGTGTSPEAYIWVSGFKLRGIGGE